MYGYLMLMDLSEKLGLEGTRTGQRIAAIADVVRHHHEEWAGEGYPDQLSREQIPLGARLVAVADTYDAIRAARPYKPARPHEEAIAEIIRMKGTQFDPRMVDALVLHFEQPLGYTFVDAAGTEETPDVETLLGTLGEAELQKLQEVGGKVMAARVEVSARLKAEGRFFDQAGIPPASLGGAVPVPVETDIGLALLTFLENGLSEKDIVFFSSRWVDPDSVKSWLPNDVFPRVAIGPEEQLRSRTEQELAALVRLAEQQRLQGRPLIVHYVTLATYQGQQYLLISA